MLAMGNAAVAGRDDDVVFYSPAQIASARGSSASLERYTADTYDGGGSTVARFGSGGLAFGINAVQYDAPPCNGTAGQGTFATGGGALGSSALAAMGFAQQLKGFRFGITGKYATQQHETIRYGTGLFDFGVAHDISVAGYSALTAAVAVQNVAPFHRTMSASDEIIRPPLRTTVGIAGGAPMSALFDVAATTALSVRGDRFLQPAGGLELSYVWLEGYALAARAGARRPDVGEGTWTVGSGLTADRISVDYALETLGASRLGHRVGLRVR